MDSIRVQARLQPDRLAARDLSTGQAWTYAALDDLVGRLAALLVARGCARGDRVAMLGKNSVSAVALHFACARAGLIYVPLNWRLSAAELLRLVEQAQPRLVLGDAVAEVLAGQVAVEPLSDFVAESEAQAPLARLASDLDRPSLILFTSGTSGRSKGVVLTERNLRETAINFGVLSRVSNSSVFLCEAPMFHVIGLVTNIRPVLMQGGAIVVSDGFQAERTLARLADPALAITHYVGVPQMMEALRGAPLFDPEGIRHLTALVSGGAPHSAADIAAWLDDGIPMVLGFGMSEAGTVFGMSVEPAVIRAKLGAVGVPMPGVETRLVDSSGHACAPGTPGELQLRGDTIMRAYWRDPEETARAIDKDGWFATGDIARCDEDGFFWIVDRKKDMFISGGENVYPAEIEALLRDYPGVEECALVGVPDPRWGEIGHLAIVAGKDGAPADDALLSYLGARLARYKLPKRISRLDSLPRTATGKIQKAALRALLMKD